MQNIAEHMEVIGADGVHIGTVDKVEGHRIKLTKKDSGEGSHKGHHHFIDKGLVAGVEGNGQRELVEALAGMRKVVSGQMTLGDLDLTKANPHQTHHAGVGHIPEDREKHGLAASYSAANTAMNPRIR